MKVVHITSSSKGGAGIAAFRLHSALREQGVSSAFISRDRTIDFEGNEIDDTLLAYKKPSVINRVLQKIKRTVAPSEADTLISEYNELKDQLNCEIATLPFSKIHLDEHPLVKAADLVHLHWISDILDYPGFFSVNKKPIVWTFHDMNPFMGLFHYGLDNSRNTIAKQLDEKIRRIKAESIAQIDTGAAVSPSRWLLNAATDSGVFEHFAIHRTIANGMDTEMFAEIGRTEARNRLHLKPSETVLLFTAARIDVARKGVNLLIDALENTDHEVTLLALGKGSLQISNKKVKIIPLGYMSNPREIASCYAAADAFVLPSLEDNLPNTMLESLSAGIPVIAFPTGGMKEHIQNGFNGILASQMNSEALGKAISEFYDGVYTFDSEWIKAYAAGNFDRHKQAKEYLDLYRDLLTHEQPKQTAL